MTALTRSAAYSTLGAAAQQGCAFGSLILLTKCAPAAVVGAYLLGQALSAPIVLLCALELRSALVADVAGEFSISSYLRLRRGMMIVAAVAFAAAALARDNPADESSLWLVLLSGATRIAWFSGEVYWGVWQRQEKFDRIAVSGLLRGAAQIVPFAIILPVAHARNVSSAGPAIAATALQCTGWLLVAALFDRRAARLQTAMRSSASVAPLRQSSISNLRALAVRTLPLGMVAAIISFSDNVPRLLLARQPHGESALAHFGALSQIVLIANLLMIQIATAAANRFALFHHADRRAFSRLLIEMAGVALLLGAAMLTVVVIGGPALVQKLYRPEYAAWQREFELLAIAGALTLFTNLFGIVVTQMRMFWPQVPIHLVVLGATAGTGLLWIPAAGLRGAAWTVLARAAVQFGLYAACLAVGIGSRAASEPGVRRADPAPRPSMDNGRSSTGETRQEPPDRR